MNDTRLHATGGSKGGKGVAKTVLYIWGQQSFEKARHAQISRRPGF